MTCFRPCWVLSAFLAFWDRSVHGFCLRQNGHRVLLSSTDHRAPLVDMGMPYSTRLYYTSSSLEEEDRETVFTLTSPTGQDVVLIGTAHLSERSNAQVQRWIERI